MGKVIVLPEVKYFLQDLVASLCRKNYFIFIENAEKYVNTITDFIESIPTQKHFRPKSGKYGAWYCKYKPNPNTVWYVSFDFKDNVYLVKYVTNKHSNTYPDYISHI